MTPEHWHRIEQIYNQAAARPRGERAIFLEQACAGDDDLRREVEGMLAGESGSTGFLEAPAMEMAARALAAGTVPVAPGSSGKSIVTTRYKASRDLWIKDGLPTPRRRRF